MNPSTHKLQFLRFLKRFAQHTEAVALIEFALVFPFFFLLLFGGLEVNRLVLMQQKLEKSGYVLADIVTQYSPATLTPAAGEINQSEIDNNVFPQLSRGMNPFQDLTKQAVIITSIKRTLGSKVIMWQVAGGGTLSGCDTQPTPNCVRSIVNNLAPGAINPGVAGTGTSLPPEQDGFMNGIPLSATGGDVNIVVVEVFYLYQPYLQQLLQDVGAAGGTGFAGFNFYLRPKIFIKRTFFIPRIGPLYALPPTFPV